MPMSTIMKSQEPGGINKFPLEILIKIFELASTHRFFDEGRTNPLAYTLIELSHVCGIWRAGIRGAPHLWTIVCGVEPAAMIRKIVVLSQQMPLTILRVQKVRHDDDEEDDAFGATSRDAAEILLAQLHRISYFQISLKSEDATDLVPLLDTHTPLLESFELCVVGGATPLIVNPFREAASPRLATLVLSGGCELSQISSVGKNLTHFHLYSMPFMGRRGPYQSAGGFVRLSHVLTQMTALTHLQMCFTIPQDIYSLQPSRILEAIHLPRLTSLTIWDLVRKCDLFLQALKCRLSTLSVMAGQDHNHAGYITERYDYYHLLRTCQQHMAPVLEETPVSHVMLQKMPYGLMMEAFRWQGGVLENPLTVEIPHTQSRFIDIDEELISRAINIIPPRQSGKLCVRLENIDGLDMQSVAFKLYGLQGTLCSAISIYGHEVEWQGTLQDIFSACAKWEGELFLMA
ncbi:hypothetical protein EYR40_006099 [Pleurotus pulmonarius]|nr:hypothetical protein EYR40_006099 [Pleurotus pulmonarius]